MKAVNWKTTLGAIITALAVVLEQFGIDISPELQNALIVIGVTIIGIFAKDYNVTGGTKPQTEEAKNRVEVKD
jgi:hypothetical protein